MKKQILAFLCGFLCIPLLNSAPNVPLPPMPPQGVPSEEELKAWAEEVNREVEKFRNSLTAEQQKQFDKDVEELAQAMSTMDEKELGKFLDDVFQAEMASVAPGAPVPQEVKTVSPSVEAPIQQEIKKPAAPPAKSIEEARSMIAAISMHIERFLRKATLIPELTGSLAAWNVLPAGAKGQELTWESFKVDLEAFNQLLYKLIESDSETSRYRHIAAFLANEKLYATMLRLRETLERLESAVEAPAFGLGTVSKQSRAAIMNLLNALNEALFILNLPHEIKTVIALFDPEAKKSLEEQEKLRKIALEDSKKPRVSEPQRPAGKGSSGRHEGKQPAYPSTPGYYSEGPAGYHPSAPDYYGAGDDYYPAAPHGTPKPAHQQRAPNQGANAPQESEEKKDKKAQETTDKKGEAIMDATADKILSQIEMYLEDALFTIKSKELDATLSDPDQVGAVQEATNKIGRINARFKTLERHIKSLSAETRKFYKDRVVDAVKEDQELLDRVLTLAPRTSELKKELDDLYKALGITHTPRRGTKHRMHAPASTTATTGAASGAPQNPVPSAPLATPTAQPTVSEEQPKKTAVDQQMQQAPGVRPIPASTAAPAPVPAVQQPPSANAPA